MTDFAGRVSFKWIHVPFRHDTNKLFLLALQGYYKPILRSVTLLRNFDLVKSVDREQSCVNEKAYMYKGLWELKTRELI